MRHHYELVTVFPVWEALLITLGAVALGLAIGWALSYWIRNY